MIVVILVLRSMIYMRCHTRQAYEGECGVSVCANAMLAIFFRKLLLFMTFRLVFDAQFFHFLTIETEPSDWGVVCLLQFDRGEIPLTQFVFRTIENSQLNKMYDRSGHRTSCAIKLTAEKSYNKIVWNEIEYCSFSVSFLWSCFTFLYSIRTSLITSMTKYDILPSISILKLFLCFASSVTLFFCQLICIVRSLFTLLPPPHRSIGVSASRVAQTTKDAFQLSAECVHVVVSFVQIDINK